MTTTSAKMILNNAVRRRPSSSSVLQPAIKQGLGRLTASADAVGMPTRLTQVAHKAPLRLLPVGTSPVRNAGAAICALSNYGAGMLQGDSSLLSLTVQAGAKLGITSQGANRIYKRRSSEPSSPKEKEAQNNTTCKAEIEARVEQDGLLVVAPDFCSMFASSSLEQTQTFEIHPTSSVVLIDWFSSGRYQNGERWQFSSLKATTKLQWINDDKGADGDDDLSSSTIPILQDSIWLRNEESSSSSEQLQLTTEEDPFGVHKINTFASLILYGDQSDSVLQKCQQLQHSLVAQHTGIRVDQAYDEAQEEHHLHANATETENDNDNGVFMDLDSLQLSGRVSCGVSKVPLVAEGSSSSRPSHSSATVVRFAATNCEDLYRVFHYCLAPLEPKFGYSFYKDRISARTSIIPSSMTNNSSSASVTTTTTVPPKQKQETTSPVSKRTSNSNISVESPLNAAKNGISSSSAMWAAYMLADSAMPTGSFAHSAGLEAAAQLGLLDNNDDVENNHNKQEEIARFIQAATRSNVQLTTPFLIAGHNLYTNGMNQHHPNSSSSKEGDSTSSLMMMVKEWKHLNRQAHAILCTNALGCAASLDQGKSLARVAKQWLSSNENTAAAAKNNRTSSSENDDSLRLLEEMASESHHIGPVLGVVGAKLGLSEQEVCELFAYCVARDMVSAAVRLSLVGPLASVKLLHSVQQAAVAGMETSRTAMIERSTTGDYHKTNLLDVAATCSPVIEAIHPCHELLQVRLFRT